MKIDGTRVSRLVDYVRGVLKKQDGKSLYLEFRSDLEAVTPHEVFEILNHVWSSGTSYDDILSVLDQKESLILYPCASEVLDPETFKAITRESFEYGFPFLDPETLPKNDSADGPPTYRGVLEVSQDITDIQKLEGQRRLLSWEG